MMLSIELPDGYRLKEVLAFHARDPEGLAEQVTENRIRKGLLIDGKPEVLDMVLEGGSARFNGSLERQARNMLGLCIDPRPFETAVQNDSLLGPLIRRQTGLRIPQAATAFEALTWAIIGQQINLRFAITLRRTLIELAGTQHESGLWCYPDAAAVSRLSADDLGIRKFSRAKSETLIRVARMVESGELPLSDWERNLPEDAPARLLSIKGIGPWTVNYALLRGFGCADCSLHGDVAVRLALHRLSGSEVRPDALEAARILEQYKPHRSLAAAHLWAILHVSA